MKLLLALLLVPVLAYAQEQPCTRDNQADCTYHHAVPVDNPLALIALGIGIAGVAARILRRKP